MKTSFIGSALVALALVSFGSLGCSDDNSGSTGTAGTGGEGADAGDAGAPAVAGTAGSVAGGGGGDSGAPPIDEAGAGGEAGAGDETAWYECQSSDQAFVRRAILGVLGRRAYSQAEVNLYTDIITQVDTADGLTDEQKLATPQGPLRHSRQVVLETLFAQPGYASHWADSYRDFIRVQRIEELSNTGCFAVPGSEDPAAVATFVRDQPASAEGGAVSGFTMHDVIAGSMTIDDMTPIYTANLFAMLSRTYLGANALPAALEITRRRDFGAWFDASYLHRDAVCLGCHNSEFSVTQTADPKTNRHYPLPFMLEKSLFGDSTGPGTFGGFEGGDRMHAPLRFDSFVNQCDDTPHTQAEAEEYWYNPGCDTPEEPVHYCSTEIVCDSTFAKMGKSQPWGWAQTCGRYLSADQVPSDIAGVEASFGSISGLRSSPWGLASSLRSGFEKLRTSGLGATAEGEVPDSDKAFAYLVAMTVAENVWLQIVGTPLTIPTRFPRNAAARDQLEHLADTFVSSGFSNQKLIEAVFASPYVNMASPESGCGSAYTAPAVFDPWVIADQDPVKRKNSAADGVASLTSRNAASAMYAALSWARPEALLFPDVYYADPEDPQRETVLAERQFQSEVGFYLKSSEPGFRGFDFQARLGWEDRFATCSKLPGDTATDFIDQLAASASSTAKVRDLVSALKDRMVGRAGVDEATEKPALEGLLGASLDAPANTLPQTATALRKLCGVIASSPQFLLDGLPAADSSAVPTLTPPAAGYAALCTALAAGPLPEKVKITCNGSEKLTVTAR